MIECGTDPLARIYLYEEKDTRASPRFLAPAEAKEFATEIARALRHWWVLSGKHGP